MRNNKSKSVIFANIVLGGTTILFIIVIFYICYKSTSLQIPLNLKLIVLLTAGLLFSIVMLFLREKWKINIAITIFSIVIAAYGVEFMLFFRSQSQFSPADIDTRNKLEVIEDLRAEGVDAWPHVIPYLFVESNGLLSDNNRIFPLGGISQKTIVYCNESGQYVNFKSDEHGFNNPEGLYKKGEIKVALLGDSYVHGACVQPEDDIANQLRNMGINSLNLGNGGNGPLIELAVLKEYVEPIQPEIVLWVFYEGNDLFELEKERKSSILMRYLEDNYSNKLLERQGKIDSALTKYVNSQWVKELHKLQLQKHHIENLPLLLQKEAEKEDRLKIIKLWYLRNRIGLINMIRKPKREVTFKTQLPLFSEILATAYQRSTGWGGKFYFVYLPTEERYVNNNFSGSFFDRDDVLAIVHKLGIPLIDFHEVLSKHPDPLSLTPFLGAHYNAQGYKLVSEFIVSRLKKDRLISRE
jgi:hypothetical protein